MGEEIILHWFFIELVQLIKELTRLHGVFHTSHSRLFIIIGCGFGLYILGTSVLVIIMSSSITSLNLAFL
jgi:hypothetical protein